MSKLPRGILGFIFAGLILAFAVPNLTAPLGVDEATAAPNDATIFTGQIIPAFIGGAYDPTEAFQKLAGLPVYVIAYDNWGQANKIKNNLAVRTQIRADGTFQAAGLPTAAHYGVYFPFQRDATVGARRTDNITEGTQRAEFRWPELPDQIIDVFSYSFVDGTGITVKDQLGADVTLGQLFTTTTTRVDKDNNINVFPVVPVKTLKVTIEDQADFSYEVYAQRITRHNPAGGQGSTLSPVLNFPIIKGRTSPAPHPSFGTQFALHTFQAYAPEGIYAITVWRSESGSATYKDWDGATPVNSAKNGFATLRVRKDWQEVAGDTNRIPTAFGRVKLWGTVTNDQGFLMSDENASINLADLDVSIATYKNLDYKARSQNGIQNLDFYTPGHTALPDHTVWGIYMISESILDNQDHTLDADSTCLYIANDGYRDSPTRPNFGVINSTYGPVRVDLQASQSQKGHASGYDQGVILQIVDSSGNPITDATARVGTTEDTQRFPIPALTKSYTANCIGQIYLPDTHLKREQDYLLEIRSGNRIRYHPFNYPGGGYYDNSGAGIVLQQATAAAYEPPKLFGLIPLPFALAAAGEKVTIDGSIRLEEKLQNFEVFFYGNAGNKFMDEIGDGECPSDQCYIEGNFNPAPPEDEFKIVLPVPLTPSAAKTQCESDASLWDRLKTLNCRIFNDRSVNTATYDMVIQAYNPNPTAEGESQQVSTTYTLTVRSDGTHTPRVDVDFTLDCAQRFPMSWANPTTWGGGRWLNRSACEFGKFFIQKSTSLMDSVQHWLYIRPLTQEKGVVDMWNIMRNITNVTFVLMLIAIGLASILRYEPESWSPAILIPRLLVAIVFANFSLLIVQALVDFTNVLTNGVFSIAQGVLEVTAPEDAGRSLTGAAGVAGGAAASAVLIALAGKLSVMGISVLGGVLTASLNPIFLMPVLSAAIGIFFSILLFLLGLIILFYTRYFAIWVMVIAAPVVWAAQVLPLDLTQTLKEKWRNTLLTFTFMQPMIAAVLSIGMLLLAVVGSDNSFIGGFGIAIMGIITLLAVFKVPAMMSELTGEGFVSTEGLGQAPEGLREKVFGKEGLMEERFSAEKLAKGYRTATARGSGKLASAGQALFGTATGRLQQEEKLEELVKESKPIDPSPKVKADIALGRERGTMEANTELKVSGAMKADVKPMSTEQYGNYDKFFGFAPKTTNFAWHNATTGATQRGDVGQFYNYVGAQTGLTDEKEIQKKAVQYMHASQKGYDIFTQSSIGDPLKDAARENVTEMSKYIHATKTD